jgi:hypothetical protein
MSLDDQSRVLVRSGRGEEALAASEEAIRLVLPMLEPMPYVLPDAGHRLLQNYLERCTEVRKEPDQRLVQRMRAVVAVAGVLTREEG